MTSRPPSSELESSRSSVGKSFARHLIEQSQLYPELTAPLAALLSQLAYAAKILAHEISRAALVGLLGLVGEKNPTGDTQKKLDVFSNATVIEAFIKSGLVWAMVSEELEEPRLLDCDNEAQYLLCIDPLDGSSNTDINGDVGTIFGVYERSDDQDAESAFYRKGREQVAAGYILYGASTVLVYSAGQGVSGFTLDRGVGEFLLSHENIRCPQSGNTYSANLSRLREWTKGVQRYVRFLDEASSTYSLRYNGALVADFHRCLLEGGVYFYPADPSHANGKLRLLYECAPLAFLAEQAGGQATNGAREILDIPVESIHQRSPLVIGSRQEVTQFRECFQKG